MAEHPDQSGRARAKVWAAQIAAARGSCCRTMWPSFSAAYGSFSRNGRWPKSRPGGCFPGSASPSAPALSFISPPTASRRYGRRSRSRLSASSLRFLARRSAVGFPLALGFAASPQALPWLRSTPRACASGAAHRGFERQPDRLCRSARRARTQRPHRRARTSPRWPDHWRDTGTRTCRRAQGHRAAGRHVRVAESASVAAARADCVQAATISPATCISPSSAPRATRSAKFRPKRRRLLRAWRCVFPRPSTSCARRSTSASAPSFPATKAFGSADRKARCHHAGGERCVLRLKPRPCSGNLGLSHGGGRRHRLLLHSRHSGSDAVARKPLPDQEMGGVRRVCRRRVLPGVVRRQRLDPARIHHDRHRARRGDRRSCGADVPDHHNCGLCRADAGAVGDRAPEFSRCLSRPRSP